LPIVDRVNWNRSIGVGEGWSSSAPGDVRRRTFDWIRHAVVGEEAVRPGVSSPA
jgi:hypothetical protein